jgi:Bacterial extracellular solute-binding protein
VYATGGDSSSANSQRRAGAGPLLTGGRVAEFVAKGEAELGIALINEILSFPGAELLGPLPPEVQDFTVFATGVGANAKEPEAGGALIKFLTAPSAVSVIKAKGMEPALHRSGSSLSAVSGFSRKCGHPRGSWVGRLLG